MYRIGAKAVNLIFIINWRVIILIAVQCDHAKPGRIKTYGMVAVKTGGILKYRELLQLEQVYNFMNNYFLIILLVNNYSKRGGRRKEVKCGSR